MSSVPAIAREDAPSKAAEPGRGSLFVLFTAINLVLVSTAMARMGLPLDLVTWGYCVAAVAMAAVVFVRVVGLLGLVVAPFALVPALYLHIPESSYMLQDVRGGRRGVRLAPGLRFGHDGPNTALMETYLGPLKPRWDYQCIRSRMFGLGEWRDGNERVNAGSLIRRDDLLAILNNLPSDDARRQVLECLTDADNLARMHQGLLLLCVKEWGFPDDMAADAWWTQHRSLFKPIHDVDTAIVLTKHWSDHIRAAERTRTPMPSQYSSAIEMYLNAVRYQEQGQWGGDEQFGRRMFMWEMDHAEIGRDPNDYEFGYKRVRWWPISKEAREYYGLP